MAHIQGEKKAIESTHRPLLKRNDQMSTQNLVSVYLSQHDLQWSQIRNSPNVHVASRIHSVLYEESNHWWMLGLDGSLKHQATGRKQDTNAVYCMISFMRNVQKRCICRDWKQSSGCLRLATKKKKKGGGSSARGHKGTFWSERDSKTGLC